MPRLIKAMQPLRRSNSIEAVREAHGIFRDTSNETPWGLIKNALLFLFEARRANCKLTHKEAIRILEQNKMFEPVVEALKFSNTNLAARTLKVGE